MDFFLNLIGLSIECFAIITLTTSIFFCTKNKLFNWLFFYTTSLLIFEISSFSIGIFNLGSDTFLFLISFCTHFLFLTYFYHLKIFTVHKHIFISIISIGIAMFTIGVSKLISFLESDIIRFLYSISITIYSLTYIYKSIYNVSYRNKSLILFNYSILCFFSIDAFLSIATDFLVKEQLVIVGWFWFIRGILLLLFYIFLLNYTLKVSTLHK